VAHINKKVWKEYQPKDLIELIIMLGNSCVPYAMITRRNGSIAIKLLGDKMNTTITFTNKKYYKAVIRVVSNYLNNLSGTEFEPKSYMAEIRSYRR